MSSAIQFANEWYKPEEIFNSINTRNGRCEIPHDVHSREFADWLCAQYRLAMAKGIQIGREQSAACKKCSGTGSVRRPGRDEYMDCQACDGRGS